MPEDRGTLRRVAWLQICPWLCLFRTAWLALDVRKLLLAAVGLVLTSAGWWAVDGMFSSSVSTRSAQLVDSTWPWEWVALPSDGVDVSDPISFIRGTGRMSRTNAVSGPTDPWHRLASPFMQFFATTTTLSGCTAAALKALWALAVWALFGGVITRLAVVQLAQERRYELSKAGRLALRKWLSYFAAPLFPLIGVLFCAALLAIGGLVMRAGDAGFGIGAVLWPLALLLGLLMAALLVAVLLGWPLMWATVSAEERGDAFDALARAYGYVYQRPFHYVFYVLLAALIGGAAFWAVVWFADLVIYISAWGASWGAGRERFAEILQASYGDPQDTGQSILACWVNCVRTFVAAFAYSYFWTAWCAIYLLLRRDTDNTEMDEVYLDEVEDAYGLPPLKTDEAGVPVVAREESSSEEEDSGPGEEQSESDDPPPENDAPQ